MNDETERSSEPIRLSYQSPVQLNYQSPLPRDRGRLFRWPFFAAFPFTWAYWLAFGAFFVNAFFDPAIDFLAALIGLIVFGIWCYVKRSRAFGAGILASIILTPVIIFLVIYGICYMH